MCVTSTESTVFNEAAVVDIINRPLVSSNPIKALSLLALLRSMKKPEYPVPRDTTPVIGALFTAAFVLSTAPFVISVPRTIRLHHTSISPVVWSLPPMVKNPPLG